MLLLLETDHYVHTERLPERVFENVIFQARKQRGRIHECDGYISYISV